MGGGGGGKVQQASAPERTDPAVQEAIERERELARRRRGRRATILTSPSGIPDTTGGGRTLLGK